MSKFLFLQIKMTKIETLYCNNDKKMIHYYCYLNMLF